MKVKVTEKKKLYLGMAELKDYEIAKAIEGNYAIKVIYDDKFMILKPADLKKGRIINTQQSIINPGQSYKLVGFAWKPTGMRDQQVSIDFATRGKLSKLWKEVAKQKGL